MVHVYSTDCSGLPGVNQVHSSGDRLTRCHHIHQLRTPSPHIVGRQIALNAKIHSKRALRKIRYGSMLTVGALPAPITCYKHTPCRTPRYHPQSPITAVFFGEADFLFSSIPLDITK